MHPNILILLAVVLSDLVTAGLVHRRSYPRNLIRSFNQSSIPIAPEAQHHESTTEGLLSTLSKLPMEATSVPLAQVASVSSIAPSGQVGSVLAIGNGPGAASIISSTATIAPTQPLFIDLPSSKTLKPTLSTTSSSSADGGASVIATTKQVGSAPAFGSGSGAASEEVESLTAKSSSSFSRRFPGVSGESVNPTGTKASAVPTRASLPSNLIQTSNLSVTVTSSSTQQKASVLPSTKNTTNSTVPSSIEFRSTSSVEPLPSQAPNSPDASSTKSSASITSSSGVSSSNQAFIATITSVPASQGNVALAIQYNQFFSAMSPNSACDGNDNSRASACINQQIAKCGSNGRYILTACPEGQQCRALPLDADKNGISIQCIRPSDADTRLSPGNSAGSAIAPDPTPTVKSITPPSSVQEASSTIFSKKGLTTSIKTSGPSSKTRATSSVSIPKEAQSASLVESANTTPQPNFSTASTILTVAAPSTTQTNSVPSDLTTVSGTATTSSDSSPLSSAPTSGSSSLSLTLSSLSTSSLISSATSPQATENPSLISEASTTSSVQTPLAVPTDTSQIATDQPTQIIIVPLTRSSAEIGSLTTTPIAIPTIVMAVIDSAITTKPTTRPQIVTVTDTETVTVTATVHDRR